MMVKEARYVDDIANRPLPLYEPQPIALKAMTSMETLPNKVAQVEPAGLNEEEMSLVIKRFKTASKGHKDYPNKNKSRGKRSCFKCSKTIDFIARCLDNENDLVQDKKGKMDLLPQPLTNPLSSPMSITLASWKKRRRDVPMIPLSIVLLVMRNVM
jgi:hypothetical protein